MPWRSCLDGGNAGGSWAFLLQLVPRRRCVLFNASVAPKSRLRWKHTQESAWLVELEESPEPGAPTCGFVPPYGLGERGPGRGDHGKVSLGPAERGDRQ